MAAVNSQANDTERGRLVSVVMPCYNAEAFVAEAIASVLGQTHAEVEVIVVDDGSTDGSKAIVARLATQHPQRIRAFELQHAGPYHARNEGIAHARGAFIAFLDADDWWRTDCLERLYGALQAHPQAAVAYCGWQNIGAEARKATPFVPPDYEVPDKVERFLRAAAPWPIHAALVRRAIIEEARGFQTFLPSCMDYDLWLRIGLRHPIVLVPEVLAYYRHHGNTQITSTQWRQAWNTWLVKQAFIREHPQMVTGIGAQRLRALVDGGLLRRGYHNYRQRDFVSARHIFRRVLKVGGWRAKDLAYLLPSLLPERLYLACCERGAKRGEQP